MRIFVTFLLGCCLAVLVNCASDERAQQAADGRAGIGAAVTLLTAARSAPDIQASVAQGIDAALAILGSVDKRLPAISGVPSASWPAPLKTPAQIAANPGDYVASTPPEPSNAPWVVALSTTGLALLWGIGRVAPTVFPGFGTPVAALANLAWSALAHKDQKAAEAGRDQVVSAAQTAQPILAALAALPPGQLPAQLQGLLSPIVRGAIGALSDATASATPAPVASGDSLGMLVAAALSQPNTAAALATSGASVPSASVTGRPG